MPNWTEQELHVVGPTADIDRFIRIGLTTSDGGDDLLHFDRLCPRGRGERKKKREHDSGVVLLHFRTRTQASFSMITSVDYPARFYARLAECWPHLAFACSVNGETGDFGGLVFGFGGHTHDLVRDYGATYSLRAHRYTIRRLLREWMAFLTDGRPFRVVPGPSWKPGAMPFDAHFDEDCCFYFRTRREAWRFGKRYR
jgi:hypothetical protein